MQDYSVSELKRLFRNAHWVIDNAREVNQRRGFKAMVNYLRSVSLTSEDGASILHPLYRHLPARFMPYPIRIEVEPTTKCFLKCPKCEHSYWSKPWQNMPYGQLVKILDRFSNISAISMSGIGHNFQNPDYLRMLEYACSKDLYVQFFDTLLLLNEDKIRTVIEMGVSKINMSLDGATKDVYEKCQVGSNFEKVVQNAKTLSRLKKEMNTVFPEQAFSIVVLKHNQHQLVQLVELIEEIVQGCQRHTYIEFIRLIPFKENEHLMPDMDYLAEQREKVLRKYANRTSLRFRWAHFFKMTSKMPLEWCLEFLVPFILVDGTVYPCCALTEGNQRSKIRPLAMGNILEVPFKDIWQSKRFRELRQMLRRGDAPLVCYRFRECTAYATEHAKGRRSE